ncbi:MAG: radical SAM protein [Candidatus Omnitrophota bacterium]|nr:B12-binding domain-containing radical SAM protein [Candidatus Omnitrophota bacterium]MBU1928356.1 B12-binding domain-containing radical SAM protein [Candidatus Omnitrophota bacterium]MBU2035157.1 B12-binding domain-containing radical SAM protein [Candidatus Omnitrophota bacterium]MBU2221772.1 B12-binding domain-containing radical SAM protein [Candidatus Omnitrophota bacterium]MBU2257893.1 B12-binding domain-containing radical SAM protein [Candidatus Omnitrophota bacterium]
MVKEVNKILLVQAPPWGVCAPPLGVAYLSTFLRSRGFNSEIMDLNIQIFNDPDLKIEDKWDTQDFEFWASGNAVEYLQDSFEDFAEKIIAYGAPIIGFSATFASVPFLNVLLSLLRKKGGNNLTIIVGGGGVSYPQGRILFKKEIIDYFVVGEGEIPLTGIMNHLQNDEAITGENRCLVWKDRPEDRVLCIRAADVSSLPLDDIPFPTFEEFNLDSYSQKDLLPLISSRGCIKSCVFCCDAPIKKPYRYRSAEKVAGEIKYLFKKYNRKRLEFSDLLLNGNLDFLDKLCGFLIEMNLGVCWGGQATIRKDMDAQLFKKMKKAGCGGLTFGCESFSDRLLYLMRKGMKSKDAQYTFMMAKDAGMLVEVNLIVGFPGETDEDVDATARFLKDNAILIDKVNSLNICTIGPGMYLYDHLSEYNIDSSIISDWYSWFDVDRRNTIGIRTDRHRKLLSVCAGLGLSPSWKNVKKE